jgi:hypothetical protein
MHHPNGNNEPTGGDHGNKVSTGRGVATPLAKEAFNKFDADYADVSLQG